LMVASLSPNDRPSSSRASCWAERSISPSNSDHNDDVEAIARFRNQLRLDTGPFRMR
jgi:hypothetical protein